jgi:hypothetical protein
MRTEYTRQTRWGHDPEPVGADQPAGSTYVKMVVWMPCGECDLQVHASYTHSLTAGVVCPECGRQLALPASQGNRDAAVKKTLDTEEQFREQL